MFFKYQNKAYLNTKIKVYIQSKYEVYFQCVHSISRDIWIFRGVTKCLLTYSTISDDVLQNPGWGTLIHTVSRSDKDWGDPPIGLLWWSPGHLKHINPVYWGMTHSWKQNKSATYFEQPTVRGKRKPRARSGALSAELSDAETFLQFCKCRSASHWWCIKHQYFTAEWPNALVT